MTAQPQAKPTSERVADSRAPKSPGARTERGRAQRDERRLVQSLVQAAIATLLLAVVLGGTLWLASSSTTKTKESAERKQQRPDDIHVGQVVVGQGSSDCRALSFDNSTGAFKDGSPEPCLVGQNPPQHGFQRGRFEAVRRQFTKPGE